MGYKKSIATHLAFTITLIIVIIISVSVVSMYYFLEKNTHERIKTETALKSMIASTEIDNIFENASITTSQMAINPLLIEYLKSVQTRDQITNNLLYKPTLALLQKIQSSSKTYFLAWVANEQANFYLDSNGVIPDLTYEVIKRPWYKIASTSKDVEFTTPYIEWGTKRTVISSIKALREQDDTIYGFVVVDIVMETIPSILKEVKLTDYDYSFLLTEDGTYVYHDQLDKIMNNKITDKGELLQPFADLVLQNRSGFEEVVVGGEPMYLSFHPVSDTGWIIATLVNKKMMSEDGSQIFIVVISILILGLVIVLISVLRLVQIKLRPIAYMSELADQISKGQFAIRLSDEYLNRTDEMGSMANSFQKIMETYSKANENLEEKIMEKNQELAAQYRHIIETEKMASLGNLVAGVAHEINTPLGVSMSATSYLSKIRQESNKKLIEGTMTRDDLKHFMDELDESLGMLTNNLNRAADLIKSFKQVAVDQSNDGRTLFNLKDNIDVVITSLKHEYKHQRHKILNNCPSYLMIDSYPGVYSQIFSNFVMNSIHHGFKGREEGEMIFDCSVQSNHLIITYRDNGLGIKEDDLSKIYEPFFTTNRSKGNNGLGMHIVYNIITQKLKGSITCYSAIGQGVKFIIEVPLVLEEQNE